MESGIKLRIYIYINNVKLFNFKTLGSKLFLKLHVSYITEDESIVLLLNII
jgi:hypothetical protein